jgi:hypothetical protein
VSLPFRRECAYRAGVSSRSPEHWSLAKSLAFLAATFAIVFGSLLPAAVAASPALGAPVVLCSGDAAFVVYDEDGGHPAPIRDTDLDSLGCAAALLSGLAATASPPPTPAARLELPPFQPAPLRANAGAAVEHPAPRPPSTAPPRP